MKFIIYIVNYCFQICKDKEQAEIWFVGLKALISGSQFLKLYTDSRSDGGLPSNSSSPAGYARRKQPFSFMEDAEKLAQSTFKVCVGLL